MNYEVLRRLLIRRRAAYASVFGGERTAAKDYVLSDLRKFCRADVSTTIVSPVTRTVDPCASAQAEGRREVWLRIVQCLNLSDADINKLVNHPEDDSSIS